MSSDRLHASDDDHPSTSSSSFHGHAGRRVKLLCSYGGKILPRPSDNVLRYAGGDTRIVTVRRDCSMPEILRRFKDLCGSQVVFKYQLPGEELDALISVSTAEDLANMMEEHDKLVADDASAKLRVFLYSPSELAGGSFEHEFPSTDQEQSSRYIEAVNGMDTYLQRKDSITSFLTSNSDGTAGAEFGTFGSMEGMLPPIPTPTATSPNDQLSSNSASQNVSNLPNIVNSGNALEGLNAVQPELPQLAPYMPQAYGEPHHAQFMNPQPFVVVGLPTQLSMMSVPPPPYVPVTHVPLPPASQTSNVPVTHGSLSPISLPSNGKPIQTRADLNAAENSNVVKIPRPPSDPKLLPLSQFPPLPSPHLLAPSSERNESRQVQPPLESQTLKFEDCSLCQKGLHHVHSDTLIHEKTNGSSSAVPETKLVLQSHHSEDMARLQIPKMVVAGALVGNMVEPQAGNVIGAAPLGAYGLTEIIPEVPHDDERPAAFVAENLDHVKTMGQPSSLGLQEPSQSYEITSNPQKPIQEDVMQKKTVVPHVPGPNLGLQEPSQPYGTTLNPQKPIQEDAIPKKMVVPQVLGPTLENHGPANVLLQPTPLVLPTNPSGMLIGSPQSHLEGPLQEQLQLPQAKIAENLDHGKTSGQPISVGLQIHAQSSLGTATNSDSMHKKPVSPQALNPNGENDHANVYIQPTPLVPPNNPSVVLTGSPQYYQQFPQTKIPVKQEGITKPLVADVIPVRSSNLQAEGQVGRENVPVCLSSYVRPLEGVMQVVHVNPPETSAFSDYPKPVSVPDNYTIKDPKTETLPLIVENGNTVKQQNASAAMPVDNLLLSSGVIPEANTVKPLDPVPSASQSFVYIQNPQPIKYVTGNDVPSRYYQEAGSAVVGMASSIYNGAMNSDPTGAWKHGMRNLQPKEVMNDITMPSSANSHLKASSHAINMEPVQMTSDSFFFNDDSEKIVGSSSVLPPRSADIVSKDSVVMKDMHPDIYSANSQRSDLAMPSEGVSWFPPSSQNKDMHVDLARSLKEDEHTEQDMQASVEEKVAQLVNLSKSSVPDFISHESVEINPRNADHGSKESSAVIDDDKMETMKTNKQSEKTNNGFPNMDNVGHLQVIKNSDLEELRELGSGTFGTVYHGKWRGTDVAIKRLNDRVFNGKQSDQEKARADFWNEACKLASLHHPNVVAFYGIVLDGPGGSIATVTEFMVNGSLRNVLQKNDKALDRRRRLIIAMDVAFGMEYLHSKNIIHFDLKSDNLLVNLRDPQRPICKVGDLGLSKLKYETLMSGGMRGTLPWMAPELLGGTVKHTEKVDVFSFGIVMWELLTSKEPYADLYYGVIIGGIINNKLRPEVPESCDPDWRSLMEQCWSNEASERPSFTEIASRLRAMSASPPQKG